MQYTLQTHSEIQTKSIAAKLAHCCISYPTVIIYLYGELGAGKTTFTRGFINYFGEYIVKSPTYSLIESYDTPYGSIHHFDLYRINDPVELDHIGIRDYTDTYCLFEWPQMGEGVIPVADISITLSNAINDVMKKSIAFKALTQIGEEILHNYADD